MHAYGQRYLAGQGDLLLIYPQTGRFTKPLPPFDFSAEGAARRLRLWVVPFCLDKRRVILPPDADFSRQAWL